MYLYIFKKNHIQALARFHQSSHNLEVEKGRWQRKLIDGKLHNHILPVEERLCILCPSGHVDSKSHVLMLCNIYSDLRSNLFHVAKPLIANFNNLDVNSTFIAILESQTPTVQSFYDKKWVNPPQIATEFILSINGSAISLE